MEAWVSPSTRFGFSSEQSLSFEAHGSEFPCPSIEVFDEVFFEIVIASIVKIEVEIITDEGRNRARRERHTRRNSDSVRNRTRGQNQHQSDKHSP